MKLLAVFLSLIGLGLTVFALPAQAVCPICTIAVAGGLGISRMLGIDDVITGVWIGGLIISTGMWTADFTKKRKWPIPHSELLSIIGYYLLVLVPLYWSDFIGLPGNTLGGVDKIILGTAIGSFMFIVGMWLDKYLRKINDGKVFVYFQKVLLPVSMLTITSVVLYLVV